MGVGGRVVVGRKEVERVGSLGGVEVGSEWEKECASREKGSVGGEREVACVGVGGGWWLDGEREVGSAGLRERERKRWNG